MKIKVILKPKVGLLLLTCLLIAFVHVAQAQQPGDQVMVKLKNGSVLKGTLLAQTKDNFELQIGNAARMSIPVDYVAQLLLDEPLQPKGYALIQSGLFFGQRDLDDLLTLQVAPSVQLSAGYAYRYWLQGGLGTGLEQYGKITVYPVFAELRGNFFDRKVSPYYALKAGSSFVGLKDDSRYQKAEGGLMAEVQLGLNIDFKGFSWQLGTGFHQQKVTLEGETNSWGWGNLTHSRYQLRNLRRFIVSTSFRFSF